MVFSLSGQPYSVDDPDADAWAEMVRQNQLLQAPNDPFFSDGSEVQDVSSDQPVSVADPDAQAWNDMVQQNQQLQAANDPTAASEPADSDAGAGPDDPSAGAPSDDPVTLQSLPTADPQGTQVDEVPLDPSLIPALPTDDALPPSLADSLPASGLARTAPPDGADPDGASDGGYLDDGGPAAESSAGAMEIAQLLHPGAVEGGASGGESANDAAVMGNGVDGVAALISQGEGTTGEDGYDKVYRGKNGTWYPPNTKKPSELTVNQWIAMGPSLVRANGNSPMGKYQITTDTLKDLKKQMGLNGDEVMAKPLQDRMMRQMLSNAKFDDFLAGENGVTSAEVQNRLAGRWDSLAADSSNLTHQRPGKTRRIAPIKSAAIQSALNAAKATYDANNQRIDEGYLPLPPGGLR